MTKKLDKSGTLKLVLGVKPDAGEPIGVAAAPPWLPSPLWRLPGESADQPYNRAIKSALGTGVAFAWLLYAADSTNGASLTAANDRVLH